jgi:hypothetical protein
LVMVRFLKSPLGYAQIYLNPIPIFFISIDKL